PRRNADARWRWAAAAMVLVGGAATWHFWQASKIENLAVAEIVDQEGVVWSDDSTALHPDLHIMPGRLKTSAGAFTLQFRPGASVHVVGAASLNIESPMLVGLEKGQATTRVTESSKGFTLTTPLVNVVDQGTQFGVAIGDDGKTDVVVFEGKVDLH